jgi:hypothetical protein
MTRKQQILRMVDKLPDDISFDRVMHYIGIMRDIETGVEQVERGEGIDHDELFDNLLAKYEKRTSHMVPASKRTAGKNRATHRPERTDDRSKVHPSSPKKGRKTEKIPGNRRHS